MDFTNEQNNYEILSPEFKVEQIKKCNTAKYTKAINLSVKVTENIIKKYNCYAFKQNGIINLI